MVLELDVEKYKSALQPRSIFAFLPDDFIRQMMRGFFLTANTGVALYHADFDELQKRWIANPIPINPFRFNDEKDRKYYSLVCLTYRDATNGERPGCQKCDRKQAQEIIDSNRTGLQPYQCWLGFDEFAFPLTIGGRVRAVILTGQCIPEDDEAVARIAGSIREKVEDRTLAEELMSLIEPERRRRREIDPDYRKSLRDKLCEFGGILQGVMDRLHKERESAAIGGLCRDVAFSMASFALIDSPRWRKHCEELLHGFRAITGVGEVRVFARQAKYFEQRVPDPGSPENGVRLRARDVIPNAPEGNLVVLDCSLPQQRELIEALKGGAGRTFAFRHDTGVLDADLKTLITICDVPESIGDELLRKFCETFCIRFAISSLLFLIREAEKQHRAKVGEAAHSLRTPLQCLMLDLDALARAPGALDNEAMQERLKESQGRITDAQEDIRSLLDDLSPKKELCDFSDIVDGVMKALRPLADSRPCRLEKVGQWPRPSQVLVEKHRIRAAVTALVQNAIKYSYQNLKGVHETYSVKVRVVEGTGPLVMVVIDNYGVGIPPDLLDRLGKRAGERAGIHDGKVAREGTGWGVPTAMWAFEDNGGWVEIESKPGDDSPRKPDEQYHRYNTRVRGCLPLAERNPNNGQ